MLVCLDMDEVFCKHLTKEWLENAELDMKIQQMNTIKENNTKINNAFKEFIKQW